MLARGALRVALLAGSLSAVSVHAGNIAVTTTGDSVDGDVSSIQALMARPGADGVSIREAVAAAANTDGHHRIAFSPALSTVLQDALLNETGVSSRFTLRSADEWTASVESTPLLK